MINQSYIKCNKAQQTKQYLEWKRISQYELNVETLFPHTMFQFLLDFAQ